MARKRLFLNRWRLGGDWWPMESVRALVDHRVWGHLTEEERESSSWHLRECDGRWRFLRPCRLSRSGLFHHNWSVRNAASFQMARVYVPLREAGALSSTRQFSLYHAYVAILDPQRQLLQAVILNAPMPGDVDSSSCDTDRSGVSIGAAVSINGIDF